ncbi:hypothetical protein TIFTF001_009602 [Ficus carica]|uniref:Verticillium wilt resistance-like protein n=1 Tax=Ficus carica TaxID=3494 RepID=A0AA87ZNE6_FICCA|nr:hypothetical protein TIFTF001_009602 [Ficus carica]
MTRSSGGIAGKPVGLGLERQSSVGSDKAITGGLTQNSSLFNLRFLESLDLSFNYFGVPIPSNFGKLTSLRYLNLSNSGFVGQIPIEISHLKNLVTLDLSTATESLFRISLLKLEKPKWSMLIRSVTKLEELYLDGVNMSATGTGWCQAFSFSSPNLRVLSLSDCSLSGPVHQSLMKLQFFSVISLDDNHLSAPVPGFIANFSELTSLRLGNCGLFGTFPKEIFQELVISSTNFSGRLPASIGNLTKLSKLDLSHCQFNGTVPTSTETLTQLVFLDLSGNKFTGSIPSFNMSKDLKEIILSHISLSGTIPSTHWEGLLNLRVVDLQKNLFGGSIRSTLFSFPSLEEIQLSSNQFTGQLHVFPNVSSLTLRVLNLRSNYLEGAIPESIF